MYRLSLGDCLCLVAVPDTSQIIVPPRTHPVYRGFLCEQMFPKEPRVMIQIQEAYLSAISTFRQ
jgi:hypothetical protein